MFLSSAKDAAYSPQLQFITMACVENRRREYVQSSSEVSGIVNSREMDNTSLTKTSLRIKLLTVHIPVARCDGTGSLKLVLKLRVNLR